MSAEPVTANGEFSLRGMIASLNQAYETMDMPVRRYAMVAIAPSFGVFVGTAVMAIVLGLPLLLSAPIVVFGAFLVFVTIIYPKAAQDRQKKQVRQRFHLFLTHITVLSLTNINRVEIFRTLAEEEEYQALAVEMGHLVGIVDTWNQSLDDACRMRARQATSPLLKDFLERLAYTVGGGQPISEFLVDEQDTIIQNFVTRYEADLQKLDVMKELYLSMMLSTAFILVFAIVLPVLIPINPTIIIAAVIVLFGMVQLMFVYAIHIISPSDPLWYIEDTEGDGPLKRMPRALAIGFGGSLFTGIAIMAILLGLTPVAPDTLPLPIMAATPLLPLLIPGWRMRIEEKRVKDRDREFPSFIRVLGAIESVKQTSTGNVLESLRHKDFGALTENVDALYKRLNMRIDDIRAWHLFSAETGSYLIQKFGDMYVVGRQMGGDPKVLGQVISKNHNQVLKVREKRRQATTTLIGVVYGLTAASVFSYFVGLEIVEIIIEVTEGIEGGQEIVGDLLVVEQYNLLAIEFLLIMVIFINAMLSSIMIRLTDRGHMVGALWHFVLLSWLGAVTAVVTQYAVNFVMSV